MSTDSDSASATFVVVGGGIAGVSCAETLTFLLPDKRIILLTESPIVKAIVNLKMVTKTLSTFDVVEKHMNSFSDSNPMITVIHDTLTHVNSKDHLILTKGNRTIHYKYLCLCMGAKPKIIPQGENSPFVLGIRDTDSVEILISKIGSSRRVTLVGNGGIATELVHKIQNVEIDWVVKDKHISSSFVDPGAAEFFQCSLKKRPEGEDTSQRYRMHMQYRQEAEGEGGTTGSGVGSGAALGPDWYTNINLSGSSGAPKTINVHYQCEVANITHKADTHGVQVHLSNGQVFDADLVVSATGVVPRTDIISVHNQLSLSSDGGILVDEFMRTSLSDVFAAGDVCSAGWTHAPHWLPMRLWTQARQMGTYAAKCMDMAMAGTDTTHFMQDFCFELFAHSTTLFGYKVVLLGLYNGQGLGTNYECLVRMTPGVEFIKFVLKGNRLQGAILIGDTDLAETCENLILNQLDLSPYGDDILNPDIDIEDYFD